MPRSGIAGRRHIRPGSYLFFLALFAGAMFASHAWLLRLPYFWDEAGQFVPTALDLMKGMWVSESVPPAVHPPGVPAYLAVCWMVAGFTPLVTRAAMLLLASLSLLAAFLLAIPLVRTYLQTGLVPRFPTAILVTGMVIVAMLCVFTGLILDTVTRGRREVRRLTRWDA